MAFYYRVNDAINRTYSALNQMNQYNQYAGPREPHNKSVRDNARFTIDPAVESLKDGVREGRYEGVPAWAARNALDAAELLRRATWDLSDRRDHPFNFQGAQHNMRRAIDELQRSRW